MNSTTVTDTNAVNPWQPTPPTDTSWLDAIKRRPVHA
jgi:hypothetical protein